MFFYEGEADGQSHGASSRKNEPAASVESVQM